MNFDQLLEKFNSRNPYTNAIGIEMTEICFDYAAGKVDYSDKVINRNLHVHGGVYVSLADTVAGAAAHSTGAHYVTQSCSFQFYKATDKGTLFCTARVNHRGRKTCVIAAKLTHEDGTLAGEGLFSFYKISDETNPLHQCMDKPKFR